MTAEPKDKEDDDSAMELSDRDARETDLWKQYSRADWEFLLDICKRMLEELGIGPDDPALDMNLRTDGSDRINVTILMRFVFGIESAAKDRISFILRPDAEKRYPNVPLVAAGKKLFNGLPKAKNYRLTLAMARQHLAVFWDEFVGVIKENYVFGKRSVFRQHHMPDLYRMAVDLDFRKAALDHLLDGVGEWPGMNTNASMDYYTEDDLVTLMRFEGMRHDPLNKEHEKAYETLKAAYGKTGYWARLVQETLFPEGYIHVLRKPTNQASKYERYQWAKIYPRKDSPKELAYTVGINDQRQFFVKIDTVSLGDNDRRRVAYFDYRGDPNSSRIVKWIPEAEGLALDWNALVQVAADFIRSVETDYNALLTLLVPNAEVHQPTPTHNPPMNTILYGPPGTGKTFHSVSHAVAIIEKVPHEQVVSECADHNGRKSVKERFDRYRSKGQVRMMTFHQSVSYEDFVEGIKPEMREDREGEVVYRIEDGLFKRAAMDAAFEYVQKDTGKAASSLAFSDRFDRYVEHISERLDSGEKVELDLRGGGSIEVVEVSDRGNLSLRHKDGTRSYTVSKERAEKLHAAFPHVHEVPNIYKEFRNAIGGNNASAFWAALNDLELYTQNAHANKTTGPVSIDYEDKVRVVEKIDWQEVALQTGQVQRHVLIIDEINRGNVAGVFGELITLLEEDKRAGAREHVEVWLPYSKKPFVVPANLYVIGTMNTADRSVEALDTALRRRFSFIEMPSVPARIEQQEVAGVDLRAMLQRINERVEQLLDRDHHIGHSYFMSVKNGEDIKRVFANKVVPLLVEYFHGDAKKVGAVLGEAFVEVRKKSVAFAKGFDMDEYDVKEMHTLRNPMQFTDMSPFKAIYADA